MRVVAHDMPPIVRASWLRGVSALPNTFAHESYIDELAAEAGVDPIEYRLRYLRDNARSTSCNAVAERAGWSRARLRQRKGRRERYRARPRLCLCAVCAQPVSGLWRGVVGLDHRRRRQHRDRRRQRDPRGRRPGFRADDQPRGGAPPDPWQRHPVDQPRADGRGGVRPQLGGQPRMGRLSDHRLSGHPGHRRGDAAAAGPAAARGRRIRLGAERRGDRQRHLRRHRRSVSRIAVHARAHPGGIARRTCDPAHPAGTGSRPTGPGPPAEKSIRAAARRVGKRRGAGHRRGRHGCGRAAGARDRADRAAGSVGLFGRHHRPRPATGRARRLRGVPHRLERRRQRRRPRHRDAVRHRLQHQHHARSRDRHRRLVLPRLRARHARGNSPRRPPALSGISLSAFCRQPPTPTCRRSMPT